MNGINLTEEDYQLFVDYKKKKDDELILKFYNKFAKDICNIIYYKVNSRFYSIPLEKDDLMSVVWKGLKDSFNDFNNNDKNNFMSYIIYKIYQTTLREIRRFLTNGEVVMNNVLSYETELEKNRNFESRTDNIVFIKKPYEQHFKDISDFILQNITKLDKNDVKKVIYLKSLGYSNKEIGKKLNFTRNYVRKIILTIKKIGESY